MAELQSREKEIIRSLKTEELEALFQFLAEAFRKKYTNFNVLELFRMQIDKDKYFHVEDVLVLG